MISKDEDFFRPSVARLSKKNFHHNLKEIRKRLKLSNALHSRNAQIMAVVKADAYGHTLKCVVPELKAAGVKFYAVASLEEALLLRELEKKEKILVLGGSLVWTEKALQLVKKHRLSVGVNDLAALQFFCRHPKVPIHLKLDTGMNRLGLKSSDWGTALELLHRLKRKIEGLYTHYASFQGAHFKHQVLLFEEALRWLVSSGLRPSYVHSENSGALFANTQLKRKGILSEWGNVVRPGISLYGYLNPGFKGKHRLKPVLELSSELGLVKTIEKAEGVSYDLTYRAKSRESIGVVSIGYADGLSKEYKEEIVAEWRSPSGRKKGHLRVAGTVCMDMVMLRALKGQLKPGDRVAFWGDFPNPLLEKGVVGPYELNCRLSKRIPRLWTA